MRTELHYLNKRGADVLSLGFQGQIANNFQYPQKNILRRTEAFMRDYYQHARNIYNITEMLAERLGKDIVERKAPASSISSAARRKAGRALRRILRGGRSIYAESREVFTQDPYRMMRVFQHAQQRHLRLSPELQQLIRGGCRSWTHLPVLPRRAGDLPGHPLAQRARSAASCG